MNTPHANAGASSCSTATKSVIQPHADLSKRHVTAPDLENDGSGGFHHEDRSSYEENNQEGASSLAVRLLDIGHTTLIGDHGHTNEDRWIVKSHEHFHLFVVIDGHGGTSAAEFLVDHLEKAIAMEYDEETGFDSKRLERAVEALDASFCRHAQKTSDYSGACFLAIILYVDPSSQTTQKVVLNCGDCRAIALETQADDRKKHPSRLKRSVAKSAAQIIPLSEDHCFENVKERRRVLAQGAVLQNKRIAGILEPFRSVGDIDVKTAAMHKWVIATPEVRSSIARIGQTTLILATDGVWSVVSNEVAREIVHDELHAKRGALHAASVLAEYALSAGSYDDITVVIVCF